MGTIGRQQGEAKETLPARRAKPSSIGLIV